MKTVEDTKIEGDGKEISKAVKKTKRTIIIGLVVLVIIIVGGFLILGKEAAKYSLKEAVFYYKGEGADSKLFYMMPGKEPGYIITLPSEKIDLNTFKVHQHHYLSHGGKILIYFEKIDEIPLGEVSEGYTAYRKVYKPKFVDLKTGSIKEINQKMDSGSLVFSPDDEDIAWILSVKESTIEELESAQKKREVWLSSPDGSNARRLAALDEKVVLLQEWYGNYVYFWGIQGVGYYSLGKIDVRTGRVKYAQPKYCLENLVNCQNFKFSLSGELFIYEAGTIEEDKETIGLFIESFDNEKSWKILVENYISDRLWMNDEKHIIYTEQVTEPQVGLREKIHIVDLETQEDKEVYSGNYISQIVPDKTGDYLYFIEKETDEKFNLVRLDIEKGETEIIDFGEYNQLKVFSGI